MIYSNKSISFSSKANVLSQLLKYPELNIPPLYIVAFSQWRDNKEKTLLETYSWAQEYACPLAVRSSCSREDTHLSSGAGTFTSLLNISYANKIHIAQAIDDVFASYETSCPNLAEEDQVLIQAMISDIAVSGVIMTYVLTDGSPYYVINYDDESGQTDSITGGQGGTKTVYIYRNAQETDFDSARLLSFVQFAKKIEDLCGRNDLDIEFCQNNDKQIYLLQVRPICSQQQWIKSASVHVQHNIDFIVDFIAKRTSTWPELYGKTTILGVMPDWNPAEIIGVTPRPLASSLYRELITKHIWRKARRHMGYRAMPPEELMIMLAGRPYIDVRVSFNSFLPEGLDPDIGEIIVSAWLEYLDANPQLHDKIEFSVAQTALDFCFDKHLNARYPQLLSNAQRKNFYKCLQTLTNKCLDLGSSASLTWALNAIRELQSRQTYRGELSHECAKAHLLLPKIILLCEECKCFGTLPFSILARHAFIAEALLRTAVERNAISLERLIAFRKSLQTIAGEISSDFARVCQNDMSRHDFMFKYGHLRPSTYDILSTRYADKDAIFLEKSLSLPRKYEHTTFSFTAEEQKNISKLMHETGLHGDALTLESYARKAIPGREWAKFIFSKNLSDVLELVALWGRGLELERETLSFLDLRHIIEWSSHALLQKPKTYFEDCAAQGRILFDVSRSLKLGYLIRSARDIYVVPQHRSAPNFIGNDKIESPVIYLDAYSDCSIEIAGHLVCIDNADPGFDWIFTRSIKGLVTMFGGTNSHMAIRCAEYGLPAAIGVGEVLFEKIRQAKHVILDAATHTLQPL